MFVHGRRAGGTYSAHLGCNASWDVQRMGGSPSLHGSCPDVGVGAAGGWDHLVTFPAGCCHSCCSCPPVPTRARVCICPCVRVCVCVCVCVCASYV